MNIFPKIFYVEQINIFLFQEFFPTFAMIWNFVAEFCKIIINRY